MPMPSWPSVYCFVYPSFAAAVVMLVLVAVVAVVGLQAQRVLKPFASTVYIIRTSSRRGDPTKWDSLETGTDCKINSVRGA